MNIRRRVYVAAVLGGLALSLSACGDGEKTSPSSSGGATPSPKVAEEKIAEGWGDLKLRFVYDGAAPAAKNLEITGSDAAICSKHRPMDESLVVGADGGLANVFVFLRPKSGEPVKVHSDYEQLVGKPVHLRNKGCAFTPHALTIWTKQPLVIHNDDQVGHNTKADLSVNDSFNQQIPSGSSIPKEFAKSERHPKRFACSAHLWMGGYMLIRDNPYMGVSARDGTLTIANIPSGHWNFIVWHERFGNLVQVEQNGQAALWSRGIARFAIKPGPSDTIEIKVDPKKYGR